MSDIKRFMSVCNHNLFPMKVS